MTSLWPSWVRFVVEISVKKIVIAHVSANIRIDLFTKEGRRCKKFAKNKRNRNRAAFQLKWVAMKVGGGDNQNLHEWLLQPAIVTAAGYFAIYILNIAFLCSPELVKSNIDPAFNAKDMFCRNILTLFAGVSCDSCMKSNFRGRRYKCLICYDYDLCASCYENGATSARHTTDHPMQCILTRSDFGNVYTSHLGYYFLSFCHLISQYHPNLSNRDYLVLLSRNIE